MKKRSKSSASNSCAADEAPGVGTLLVSQHAAVFDLDHTLIDANISFRFGKYLYRRGAMSLRKMLTLGTYYLRHKVLGMPVDRLHHKSFDCFFRGRAIVDLRRWTAAFLDEELEGMLFHPAIERLRHAQDAEAHVAILSSSPDFLVAAVAERLGVANWLATTYRVDNGGFLCVVSGLISGVEKGEYLYRLYSNGCNRTVTSAYTDSILDLALLEAAGRPTAVHPDRRLRRVCRQRGWEILTAEQ